MNETNWAKSGETGLYTVPMVARILAAKPEKLRSWVEGYGHSLKAEPKRPRKNSV
jgi:hypothetical protein